jgi:hypothetical protein
MRVVAVIDDPQAKEKILRHFDGTQKLTEIRQELSVDTLGKV